MAAIDEAVGRGSREPLIAAGARLGSDNRSYPFLIAGSALISDDLERYIDRVLASEQGQDDSQTLAEFLVLGSAYHAIEGWKYLSKAAYALLAASRNAALHLAYYAELRAARSILAGSGTCARNTWHFSLPETGRPITFGRPRSLETACAVSAADEIISTHEAASDGLRAWSRVAGNGEWVTDSVRCLRFADIDWADACGATRSRGQLAENWLSEWSVDLKGLQADSAARNVASYGVDLSQSAFDALRREELEFICEAHRASLYQEANQDGIDLALLRDFCEKSGRLTWRKSEQVWSNMRHRLVADRRMDRFKAKALVGRIQKTDQTPAGRIIQLADRNNRTPDAVFARAFLLLRLSPILQRRMWSEMRKRAPGGRLPWQETLLRQFARWSRLTPHVSDPEEYRDMEDDQIAALDDVADWLAANSFNPEIVWRERCLQLVDLCCFERAALRAFVA